MSHPFRIEKHKPPVKDGGLMVIGAGFGRTGTKSLYLALNSLGFPCYHMIENFYNTFYLRRNDMYIWKRAMDRGYVLTDDETDELFERYNAIVDFPGCLFLESLMLKYPKAKFVITVRKEADWVDSVVETIYMPQRYVNTWHGRLALAIHRLCNTQFSQMVKVMSSGMWDKALEPRYETHPMLATTGEGKRRGVESFRRWLQYVKQLIPADRLLVFDVKQGWQPLCEFLNVPVPSAPFPRTNEREEFKQALSGFRVMLYGFPTLLLGSIGVASALGVWGYSRFYRK